MKSKLKYLGIIMFLLISTFTIKSNAAMEVKSGTSSWSNISASEAYQQCYNLRYSDSTLGKNSLDPHLTLNADWAAAAYLATSSYGAVSSSQGPVVSVGGVNNYSTTGNATGVMNMGSHYTMTSSLIEGYEDKGASIEKIKNNLNTKYVETLSATNTIENTKGKAFAEVAGWWSSWAKYPISSYPVGIRVGVNGFKSFGSYTYNDETYAGQGYANGGTTFRPVIWN